MQTALIINGPHKGQLIFPDHPNAPLNQRIILDRRPLPKEGVYSHEDFDLNRPWGTSHEYKLTCIVSVGRNHTNAPTATRFWVYHITTPDPLPSPTDIFTLCKLHNCPGEEAR